MRRPRTVREGSLPVDGEEHRVHEETALWTALRPVKVAYAFRKRKNEVRVVLEW